MRTSKILLSIIAAAGAGAAIGLLYAPDKGANTRKNISEKGDKFLEGLNESLSQFQGAITKKYNSAIAETEALISNGKSKLEEMKGTAKTLAS
ncbi:MAG: YtxH domain-containing protein [Bacteroidota bacterium]